MTGGFEQSLLSYLDAPVVVGDREGCAVWVNPAFEARFERSLESLVGRHFSELFEGGGREALLRAVAGVCESGESARFRVRERGIGFAAVASPIVVENDQVGVVILLKEEVEGIEHLLAIHREIADPLDELQTALDTLYEQTGGRRAARHRADLEDALRALSRLRKWSEELAATLSGQPMLAAGAGWEPAALLRHILRRVERRGDAPEVALDLLAPASLPRAQGDADKLEAILLRLVHDRVGQDPSPASVVLGARKVGEGDAASIVVSLTERFRDGGYLPASSVAPLVKEVVAACGGQVQVTSDPLLGRATVMRFGLAPAKRS